MRRETKGAIFGDDTKADTGMLIILANKSHFSSTFLDIRLFLTLDMHE